MSPATVAPLIYPPGPVMIGGVLQWVAPILEGAN